MLRGNPLSHNFSCESRDPPRGRCGVHTCRGPVSRRPPLEGDETFSRSLVTRHAKLRDMGTGGVESVSWEIEPPDQVPVLPYWEGVYSSSYRRGDHLSPSSGSPTPRRSFAPLGPQRFVEEDLYGRNLPPTRPEVWVDRPRDTVPSPWDEV